MSGYYLNIIFNCLNQRAFASDNLDCLVDKITFYSFLLKTKPKPKRKKITTQERTVPPKKFMAVILVTLSALVLLSIVDYSQEQFHGTEPENANWVGQFGAFVGHYGFHNLGAALWLFPFLIGFLGYRFFFEQKRGLRIRQFILAIVSKMKVSLYEPVSKPSLIQSNPGQLSIHATFLF